MSTFIVTKNPMRKTTADIEQKSTKKFATGFLLIVDFLN